MKHLPLLVDDDKDVLANDGESQAVLHRAALLVFGICVMSAISFGAAGFLTAEFPIVLSHAFLAFTLGLRHAVDCDHLAAIDNVTRQLIRLGQRPISVGFWFALGHSSVVLAMTGFLATGYSAAWSEATDKMGLKEEVSLVAAVISITLLLGLGILNAKVAVGLFQRWSGFRRRTRAEQDQLTEDHAQASLRSALTLLPCIGRVLQRVDQPVKMVGVGFLFGLSFDTASQVTLIGLSAMSGTSGRLPPLVVTIFPLCFSCGMCLVDTLNGQLMLMTYSWATVRPIQKLFYNFMVTAMSACVALLISSLEILQVLSHEAGWTSPVWSWVNGIDMGTLGYTVIFSFLAVFIIAVLKAQCDRELDSEVTVV